MKAPTRKAVIKPTKAITATRINPKATVNPEPTVNKEAVDAVAEVVAAVADGVDKEADRMVARTLHRAATLPTPAPPRMVEVVDGGSNPSAATAITPVTRRVEMVGEAISVRSPANLPLRRSPHQPVRNPNSSTARVAN